MRTNRNGKEEEDKWGTEKSTTEDREFIIFAQKNIQTTPGLIYPQTHCKAPKIPFHMILFPADLNANNEHLMSTSVTQCSSSNVADYF